jgi:hypothetical protein
MEPRFGHDFSHVRVYTDAKAAESALAVNALAYTVGRDVVFGTGKYSPGTPRGKRLIAHELAHTIQQSSAMRSVQGKLEMTDPRDPTEQEAEAASDSILQDRSFAVVSGTAIQLARDVADAGTPSDAWGRLPNYAKADLERIGCNQSWFNSKSPEVRQTVLNLYVKLKGIDDLWKFVGSIEDSTGDGRLEFKSSDVDGLKRTLHSRNDFTDPEDSSDEWSSREKHGVCSLHFKHDKDWGWPETKVQAHIDPFGPFIGSYLWFATTSGWMQAGIHLVTEEEYKNVWAIRDILLGQGWDPATLTSVDRK